MVDEEAQRRQRLAALDERNREMLARVKARGMTVRPAHLSRLAPPTAAFKGGSKR
jgi:hypothetical protein